MSDRHQETTTQTELGVRPGPLSGVKVVEFAQVVAGPLAGTLMADLGADVVHVEPPGTGDSARKMGPSKQGEGLWWKVLGRNKRSVTLDLNHPDAKEVVERLVKWADVVIVTFRAKTVTRFGLDWDAVSKLNPSAILLQISGYGASSSRADEPGFGKAGEARSGVVELTGFEGEAPVHTGFSHGDSTTGLMGAFAVAAALVRRNADPERRGEWVDLALFETLFRLVEWQVVVYDQLGMVPTRVGNALAVSPAAVINTYQSREKDWITVTSATPRSVMNVIRMLGLSEERFSSQEEQLRGRDEINQALVDWFAARTTNEALKQLIEAEVVAAKIFNIVDILADATYQERDDIVTTHDDVLGDIRMQGVVPRLNVHPGSVWRPGPGLGVDNDVVFHEWLGLPDTELDRLRDAGII